MLKFSRSRGFPVATEGMEGSRGERVPESLLDHNRLASRVLPQYLQRHCSEFVRSGHHFDLVLRRDSYLWVRTPRPPT